MISEILIKNRKIDEKYMSDSGQVGERSVVKTCAIFTLMEQSAVEITINGYPTVVTGLLGADEEHAIPLPDQFVKQQIADIRVIPITRALYQRFNG